MIYLDNSATTQLSCEVKEKMVEVMDHYGNPSSRHALGLESKAIVDIAREQVGRALGLQRPSPENLIFTSCGSEANNTAILGVAYAKSQRRANKIITTDSEHPSVENVMKKLESDGFDVVRLSTRGGVIDEKEFADALDERTLLVSIMLVNNETGAVYNAQRLFAMAKRVSPSIVTHCDAVQGFLKMPFTVRSLGADLISISAHKIHGPKGVGALYVSPEIIKQKKIIPYIIGGGQEGGYRSGTENIIGIAGFGAAAEEEMRNISSNVTKISDLRDKCAALSLNAGARPNIPSGQRAPHVLSITLPDIKSETMLNFLSAKGICISAGSACSSHSKNMSPTLVGFGLTSNEADCTVRISFSRFNCEDEIETFASALKEGVDTLIRIRR